MADLYLCLLWKKMRNYYEISSKTSPLQLTINSDSIPAAMGSGIFLCGLAVMTGWFLDIGVLKSISPLWVSMKFSTALSFSLSGIMLCFIARFQRKNCDLATIILPITSSVILLLMMTLLASAVIGENMGIEEMFVKDSMTAVGRVTQGRPAIPTMISFIFIALAGFLTTLDFKRFNKKLTCIGMAIGLLGLTAVFGYILDQPLLYFTAPGISSAVACNTAILFVVCGLGLILIERDK